MVCTLKEDVDDAESRRSLRSGKKWSISGGK